MAHRQGYGQNFAQGQGVNQALWSGAVSPSNQGGIASSLLGAVPGGTNMERLAVIAKVLGNTMQANQLQNINFQAANSALQMQRNMVQQQGGIAGMASVPNALGAGLLGNSPAGLVGNQSANVLANANFQQQQRQLLLQQQQTSLLGTPPHRYQNVQPRRNNKRNNAQRSRYPSGGDRGRSGSWSRDRRTPESDQRSDEGRREEDDGPEVKKSRVDATAYDPSDPTPDDDDDGSNADQVPAGSDIQVTIQQGGEGRTVNDDRPGQQSPEQQKIYICYACNAKCYNLRNYEAHMTGNRHRQRMLKIQEFTQMRVQQATAHMQARMKAEQHLRKIEGQGLGSASGSSSGRHSTGKSNQRKPSTKLEKRWCDTCKIHFYGPVIEHRRTKDHKTSKKSSRPACHLCKVQFRSPKKMVAHCNTVEHKAKFREAQERKKTGHDEEWFPDNPEEMVTVDAVGCFDSDDEDMGDSKEAGEEDLSKEVFESNGEKGDIEDADHEEELSADIPPEDVGLQPKTDEEEFSLADLPSQDIDLRQMTGPPPMVCNIQDQIEAPKTTQEEEQQNSVDDTTPAFPTPQATPGEEEITTQEEVGTDTTAREPQESANLENEETQVDEEKNSSQAEAPPGPREDCSQMSSEMEVEENKQLAPAQVVESEDTSQTQAQDDDDDAKVQREETAQAQVQDVEDTSHVELEASAQALDTEDTTVLQTEEAQVESETLVQAEPTTEAQVQEVENTAQSQTNEAIDAQPESVNDTTNVDAIEEIQADPPDEAIEELVFPPYDPDCAVGQEFVIPITGYFCKLCHKFYKSESSAVNSHCKSQLHYNNVKAELEKSSCVKDRKCVKGPNATTEVEPTGKEDITSVPGLPMEAAGSETSCGKDETEDQMESASSTATEVLPTTTSNVQAFNISSIMDGHGFEVMEVQDNSPAEDTMNIRIVNSFSLDKNADGFGHGDEIDAEVLMEMEAGTTFREKKDCDDESGDKKITRSGTPSLMSEIEEYLTESFADKTSEAPKVGTNHKDAVEETIQQGTKLVDNVSDSSNTNPVMPTQDLHTSSPDASSLDMPGPARRGGRKTARKSTRGGRRK